MEDLLNRIFELSSPTVHKALETGVTKLEQNKLVIAEKLSNKNRLFRPYLEMYRTSMQFLLEPHKLRAMGRFEGKRAMLKLAFSDRLTYTSQ